MKAAYERIDKDGKKKIIWAVADTYREARLLASKRATGHYGEKVAPEYFMVCEAMQGWDKKCGLAVVDWSMIFT